MKKRKRQQPKQKAAAMNALACHGGGNFNGVPVAFRRRINISSFLFVLGLEFIFSDATVRAFPVVR